MCHLEQLLELFVDSNIIVELNLVLEHLVVVDCLYLLLMLLLGQTQFELVISDAHRLHLLKPGNLVVIIQLL